jgi:uncharacterized protein (DUF433 family)
VTEALEQEMYTEAEAARLLRVPQSTLHYWLEGGERRGTVYKPVLRIEPRRSRTVSWAEFVEAALLREYRQVKRIPMAELRAVIDQMREEFGVPYPLAHRPPFVSGRKLIYEAQVEAGLDPEFCLVAAVSGQYVLTAPSESFLERVVWENDVAAGWRPLADELSPIRIAPDVRFGRPAVDGISTAVLWEQAEAGETVEELARTYELTSRDVRWALTYESSTPRAA